MRRVDVVSATVLHAATSVRTLLAFDGMRGIAALSFLILHLFWNTANSEWMRDQLPEVVDVLTGLLRSGVPSSSSSRASSSPMDERHSKAGRGRAIRPSPSDPPRPAVLHRDSGGSPHRVRPVPHRRTGGSDLQLQRRPHQHPLPAGHPGRPAILSVAWTLCLEGSVLPRGDAQSCASRATPAAALIPCGSSSSLNLTGCCEPQHVAGDDAEEEGP